MGIPTGMRVGCALCELLGINPTGVRSITVSAGVDELPVAIVTLIPKQCGEPPAVKMFRVEEIEAAPDGD